MAYRRFRYPIVRRRRGELSSDYYARRQRVREAAWAAWMNPEARAEREAADKAESEARYARYYSPEAVAERAAAQARYQAEREAAEAERKAQAPHVRDEFDTWAEFVNRAEAGAREGMSAKADRGDDWTGGATFEQALRMAREGWAEGAERLEGMTARLEGRLATHATVRVPGYSVVGPGVLDMGRYLMGHPEPFMVWTEGEDSSSFEASHGVIRLIVNGCASWNLDPETIFWRGAAACAIADMAERSGARVEIVLVERITGQDGADADARIMLKRAQDHVPTAQLAFALAHAATLRRLSFGYWESFEGRAAAMLGVHGGYYGYPADIPENELEGALYIPTMRGRSEDFATAETTAQWVIKTLADHGIEVDRT